MRTRVIGAIAACVLAASAWAQTALPRLDLSYDEAVGLATRWLVEGRHEQAGKLLGLLRRAYPDDPQVQFMDGQLAAHTGQPRAAAEIFRRMLERDPSLHRVRLELARALFVAGDYEASRYHFELVLGADVPQTVRENINVFLARIDAESSWLSVDVSLARDSNPGRVTRAETVELFGQRFVLSEEARARSATGVVMAARARQAYGEDRRHFARGYLEWREFPGTFADFAYVQGTLGANLMQGTTVLSLEGGPLFARYQDAGLYRGALVQQTLTLPLAPRWRAAQYAVAKVLDYPRFDSLSATQGWLAGEMRYALSPASSTSLALTVGRNRARERPYRFRAFDASVGYLVELPGRVGVELRVSANRYRYDDLWPLFDVARLDRGRRVDVALSARRWSVAGFVPRLNASHARTHSSVALFDHRRRDLNIGVTRDF